MFYRMTNDGKYREAVERFLRSWFPGGSVTYTPKGLAWRDQWGSLRYSGKRFKQITFINHQLMGFLFLSLFGMPAPLLCKRIL